MSATTTKASPAGGQRTYRLLCADIGGTNSRWAFFKLTLPDHDRTGPDQPAATSSPCLLENKQQNWSRGLVLEAEQWLKTTPAESLNDQLRQLYAGGFPLPPEQTDLAVLAVAGPVQRQGRYSKLPLVGLEVDLDAIEQEFSFPRALLINDFTAQALAVLAPPGSQAEKVLPGQAAEAGEGAPVAIIGAGTGLGKALLLPGGADFFAPPASTGAPIATGPKAMPLVIPSEGGHADFPFAGGREQDYLQFLLRERQEERISGNTVVSGRGLSYLHHFLTGKKLEPAAVTATFGPESETMAWAARFYARVCRNFVLETLATGGLYIAGGVAAKSPQLLTHPAFAREFLHSPTMDGLLAKIPVFLIQAENSGLWGAAIKARLMLAQP
ncbi:glucokinase [Desulfurivibrio alkaliphilus]|uniref:Glucokinase n=1 Tax=Desulfurivibrio alkaliphilus (strain DSM 19089 / UNIQEM U267 / AHT2) TaxID=589865 RepID=D6Z2A8_DESAT|nr:glucokinase [Desulfurivibrio alkaliphilus]ADH85683.1 Glucokinase [Desulfurivibrio alkaliphilus AHT 2]